MMAPWQSAPPGGPGSEWKCGQQGECGQFRCGHSLRDRTYRHVEVARTPHRRVPHGRTLERAGVTNSGPSIGTQMRLTPHDRRRSGRLWFAEESRLPGLKASDKLAFGGCSALSPGDTAMPKILAIVLAAALLALPAAAFACSASNDNGTSTCEKDSSSCPANQSAHCDHASGGGSPSCYCGS